MAKKKNPLKWSAILKEQYTEQPDGGVKMLSDGMVYSVAEFRKFLGLSVEGRKIVHYAKRLFEGCLS